MDRLVTETYVLVHSPLVGPYTWSRVADVLRRRGVEVVVPRLDNTTPGELTRHHAEQVRRSVEAAGVEGPVVLVGHSAAGALLPIIGDTLVHSVAAYVFVDTDVPRDRARHFDLMPPELAHRLRRLVEGGQLPAWHEWWDSDVTRQLLPDDATREAFIAELRPTPARLLEETLRLPPEWPDAPCAYLMLSRPYGGAAVRARRNGWAVEEMDVGHLHMLVEPDRVAEAVVRLADQARATARDLTRAEATDPVLAARRTAARLARTARAVGFSALVVAIVLFATALYWGLPRVLVVLTIASLVVACVALLPAIVVGYGVAAADRDDRDGRPRAR